MKNRGMTNTQRNESKSDLLSKGLSFLFLFFTSVIFINNGVIYAQAIKSQHVISAKLVSAVNFSAPSDQNQYISTDRSISWQPGIPGGIPDGYPNYNTSTWPICTTVDAATYGNGTTDATSAINTALSNCPDHEVVYLPAGTYKITNSLNLWNRSVNKSFPSSDYNGVVLRGAGPANTRILFYGTGPSGGFGVSNGGIIELGSEASNGSISTTGSISSGSNILTVASTSHMAVGDYIEVTNGISSGIPLNTTINSISGTTLTLGANAGNTITNGIVTFVQSPYNTVNVIFSGSSTIPKGSTSLDVSNTSKISIGSYIAISQNNPSMVSPLAYASNNYQTTGSISNGSNQLTVASASGYSIGNYVTVQNGISNGTALTTPITAISGSTFTLGVNASNNVSNGIVYEAGYCGYCGDDNPNSAMAQIVQVTAVSGNTITLNRPLYYELDQNLNPTVTVEPLTQESGVEDLYLHPMQAATSPSPNFLIDLCANCWVADVESDTVAGAVSGSAAVKLSVSYASVVRDSYIHDAYGHASGSGYGVWVFGWNSDHLIENNIFRRMRHSMIFEAGGSGVVFGYNYSINNIESLAADNYTKWDDNAMSPDSVTHGTFPYMNLYEGNISPQLSFDNAHGNSGYNTAFRNYFTGMTTYPTGTPGTASAYVTWGLNPVNDTWNNDNENVVGNILGIPNCPGTGTSSYYERDTPATALPNAHDFIIYAMGYYNGGYSNPPLADPNLPGSMLREDNYNCITQSTPDSSGETVPSSLYLSGKPSWWGNSPWPAIGPDVNPMVGIIPAEQRYFNIQAAGAVHLFPGDLTGDENPPGTSSIVQTTTYYVDFARASNGDGSEGNPWKSRGNIDWTAVQTALNSGNVTIYFSSRSTWNDNQDIHIGASSSTYTLTLDGSSEYNANPSGVPQWVSETNPNNKAVLTNSSGTGGSIYIVSNTSHVTIRGFYLLNPTWAGITLGSANPSTNISNIIIDHVIIDSPVNNHGVFGGYLEAGVHDIIVRNSTIKNTPLEGIYIGHYNYLQSTITGVIIENNTLINIGAPDGKGTASINIKPGDYGAIVRNNVIYRTSTTGSGCGIFFAADNGQVYGNTIYGIINSNLSICGGHGIFLTSDGDGVGNGHAINSAFIYNNLIYGNEGSGIAISATTSTENVAEIPVAGAQGLNIDNNTIWGNGNGMTIEATVQAVQITELMNNMLGNNLNYEIDKQAGSGTVRISNVNNNLYFRPTGSSWYYNGPITWAQWQALGFDANGINDLNPLFGNSVNSDYHLLSNSPALNAGALMFTTAAAGSGNTLTLNSVIPGMYASNFFLPGDLIQVQGVGLVTVAAVPAYPSQQVILTTSISWGANEGVWFPWNGSTPDIGAAFLNASTSGSGFGMVYLTSDSSNNRINCGINPDATLCSSLINAGTPVTLTATAANGSIFSGWTISGSSAGTCTGVLSPCTLTVSTATTVKANFSTELTVIKLPNNKISISAPPKNTINFAGGSEH